MRNIFSADGIVARVAMKIMDLIIMNILMFICSIPVFTVGAAVTAVYDLNLKDLRGEDVSVVKGFFHSFKKNFIPATKVWLICLVNIVVVTTDLWLSDNMEASVLAVSILKVIAIVLGIILLMNLQYVFALTARFENTASQTMTNASLMSIAHLPQTVAMVLISLSPAICFALFYTSQRALIWIFTLVPVLWIAAGIYINCHLIHHIFNKDFQSEKEYGTEEDHFGEGK